MTANVAPIRKLRKVFDVSQAVSELDSHPELWNRYTHRTQAYGTPHRKVDDIWVRYRDFSEFKDPSSFFGDPHDSVWYPESEHLPAVKKLCMDMMGFVRGERLGGVLITRIPPGEQVQPHVDHGWHARYYDKFAIQLAGNKDQAFHFHGHHLSALPGEAYTFDNSQEHWVTNASKEARMTLIVCIRGAHHV